MLVLEHGRIPPSLHFDAPNPAIDFAALGLQVPTAARPLPKRARAVVGVNSFGFGGTNATALLAAAPPPAAVEGTAGAPPPLLLSAHSAPALDALAARWQSLLAATPAPALPALLRGAARHRDLLPHRLAARGGTGPRPDRRARRVAGRRGGRPPSPGEPAPGDRRVASCSAATARNGPAWARTRWRRAPPSAPACPKPTPRSPRTSGWSVAEALAAGVPDAALAATDRAQPLLFAVQHGIVRALAAEGIRPDLCLGHSVGEVAAAAASGLLASRTRRG
jgi:acyl transferase domain-containing protein